MIRLDVEGGKYTIVLSDRGCLSVLRNGERWVDDVGPGSKMWIAVVHELDELRKQIVRLRKVEGAAKRAASMLQDGLDGDSVDLHADADNALKDLRNALSLGV